MHYKWTQKLFAQISLSQSLDFFTVCTVRRFKDCNTKLDHAELSSLNILTLFIVLKNEY